MREITVPADQISDEIQIKKPATPEVPNPVAEPFQLRFVDFCRDVLALDTWDTDAAKIQAAMGLRRLLKATEVGAKVRVTDVEHERFQAAMGELKIDNAEVKSMVRPFRLAWILAVSVAEDSEKAAQ